METENDYIDEYGVRYSTDKKILKYVPNGLIEYTVINGCTKIDESAFIKDCRTIKELTLPKSITYLDLNIFYVSPNMNKLILYCEKYFFAGSSINNVRLGIVDFLKRYPNITEIYVVPWSLVGGYLNVNKDSLPNLMIKAIGDENLNLVRDNDCVYNSDKTILISVENSQKIFIVRDEVQRIYSKAFRYNSIMKELTLPKSLDIIDDEALIGLVSLQKVTVFTEEFLVPQILRAIPNLKEVYFPIWINHEVIRSYQTAIDIYNLHGICTIKELQISDEPQILNKEEIIYSSSGRGLLSGQETKVKSLKIDAGTTEIADYAFENNDSIEEVIFPYSLEKIGYGAFMNCKSLKRAIFTTSWHLRPYSDYFIGCDSLKEFYVHPDYEKELTNAGFTDVYDLPQYVGDIWIDVQTHLIYDSGKRILLFIPKIVGQNLLNFMVPEFVEEIHMRAFDHCQKLETITLPKTIKKITGAPFCICPNLKNIYAQGELFKDYEGILYTADKRELISYPPKRYIDKYTVEDGVIKICDYAFANHDEMRNVKLPDSLVSIGDWAFAGTRLTKIVFRGNMKIIGTNAFNSNPLIRIVFLGISIEIIGKDAFKPQAYNGEAETWVPLNSKSFFEELGKNAYLPNVVEKASHKLDEVKWEIEQDFNPVQEEKFEEELVKPNITSTKKANNNWGCLGVLIMFIFMVAVYIL